MHGTFRVLLATAVLSLLAGNSTLQAETVVKINLASDGADDVALAGGIFSTLDQGNPATTGHQDTNAVFLSFLSPHQADIPLPQASFSLTNVALTGTPTVVSGVIVVQTTTGGNFELFDAGNSLLLQGTLNLGSLSGPLGGSATGSFLTATFGQFTGGSLAHLVDPGSLSLAIALSAVKSAGGLTGLQLNNDVLLDFTADANGNIGALVPEPSGGLLASLGILGLVCRRRSR